MRAIRAVFLASGASQGVFLPFTAVILAVRGFSAAEIGVIAAIQAAAFTIAVPAWGHLADVVLGRRNALAIPGLAVAACFVAFSLVESGWGPLGDALAVNAVRDRTRDYARVRLLASLGFATASGSVGLLYDRAGYGPAFALCAFIAVALAAAARLTPDVPRANLADEAEGRTRGGSMLLLVYIGIIASFTFLPLRIVALGGSPSDVALSASVSAFAEIPAMLLTTAVAARVGLRGLMAGSALLYGACFVAWALVGSPMITLSWSAARRTAAAKCW